VVKALMRLDERGSGLCRLESAGGEEVRAGLSRVGERQAAPDEARRSTFGSRRDRLRTDRVPVSFTPLCLVVAQPPPELGQLRSPRDMIFGFPAVRGLELLLGGIRSQVDIVESTSATRQNSIITLIASRSFIAR
jgi:hypothetical protein